MLGSGVLDTAIGLVFVFLLVSMLVTIANEIISAVFLSRAKWLRVGVDRLLGSEWAQRLYDHPLIEGSATVAGSHPPGPWSVRGSGPSYIPSRSFANVLLDLVRRGDSTIQEAAQKLQAALDSVPRGSGSADELKQRVIGAVETGTILATDLKSHLDGLAASGLDLTKWVAELQDKASKVSDPALESLKTALTKLAGESKDLNVDEVRKRLQAAIDSIPHVPVAEAIKKDLSGVLERLKAGYSVGDARADIQRFIDSMPARYLREVVQRLPNERIKKTLLVLLDDAENDIDKFKQNIEIWFNNAMDRVGGWYKRRSQWVIAGLGMLVAVCMNVDAILIVKYLDTHSGVRDALVARAKAYSASASAPVLEAAASGTQGGPVQRPAGSPPALRTNSGDSFEGVLQFQKPAAAGGQVTLTSSDKDVTLRKASVPVEAGASGVKFNIDSKPSTKVAQVSIAASGAANGVATVQIDPSLDAQFTAVETKLMELNLPIGWVRTKPTQSELDNRQLVPWNDLATSWADTVAFHLLGWLLTALAATLGAPFWFDTLNRFISIRSAGKAPEEKPKPPKDVPTPLEPGQSPREADIVNAVKRS